MTRLNAEQRDVVEQLAEFLRRHADILGPRVDDDDEGYDAEQMAALAAVTHPALVEFVTVMQWVDLETGDAFSTRVHSPEMLPSHVRGLLAEWVDG